MVLIGLSKAENVQPVKRICINRRITARSYIAPEGYGNAAFLCKRSVSCVSKRVFVELKNVAVGCAVSGNLKNVLSLVVGIKAVRALLNADCVIRFGNVEYAVNTR